MIKETIYGYCPHIDDNAEISVNYVYIPILGKVSSDYYKKGFDCEYSEDCPIYKKRMTNCPLYIEAPETI